MFDIDYVFPWVNDQDPVWQKTYTDYCKSHRQMDRLEKIHNCRYRDWGLLKYLFRAIAKNMPWIRKVHLIVSNKEQVPEWLNTDEVHIVLHEDIMPPEVLPTFNSTVIEMFLSNIEGLSEHFLYGNDDMFPWNLMKPEDWFDEEGKPCYNMQDRLVFRTQFDKVCQNQWKTLVSLLGSTNRSPCKRPDHGFSPFILSKCRETLDLLGNRIIKHASAFRTEENFNQYIYSIYMYLTDYYNNGRAKFEYGKLKNFNEFYRNLRTTDAQVVCLNDCNSVEARAYPLYAKHLTALMEKRFPDKCKYER